MSDYNRLKSVRFLLPIIVLLLLPSARAQNVPDENKGIDSGDYNIRQVIDVGFRGNWVNGDQNTYNTFVNLGEGLRLFDYSLDMRSLSHHGELFDNLSFSNFGYGGDPNNVSRLRIQKNKWYEFRLLFRRDKDFWDYALQANPLNPSTSIPAIAITNSPHSRYLVRRMQDYNLTLFPQSNVRVRLGYSRDRNQGPGFWTTDGGTNTVFNKASSNATNAYRMGVDFRFLPRTTFSYDQFLNYYKQDNIITDQNLTYQLSNGRPLDLGILWDTVVNGTPCAAPISNPGTTPPTAFEGCDSYMSYSNVARPRNFMPTERFSFVSSYFKNFETSGDIGYSSANNKIPDFNEIVSALTSRTASLASTATGPANAKHVSVNADWSGIYSVNDKFRVIDTFRYDNWRTPASWVFSLTSSYTVAPAPAGPFPSWLPPIAQFTPANCPAPYTAATCPQHNDSSDPDVSTGLDSRFLGQNLKSNTFELEYDFTPRIQGRVGYLYTSRTIADFFSTFNAAETFFPGGPVGTAMSSNLMEAARGDCTSTTFPATPPVLPSGCTQNADGSVTFTGLSPSFNDTSRGLTKINEHALLLGLTARPMDTLRIRGDFEFGSNDNSYTRISPRQVQSYKLHATYTPKQWLNIDGALDIRENRDNVPTVNYLQHARTYSFMTILSRNSKLSFDIGYSYTSFSSQADICYFYGFAPPDLSTTFPCPTDSVDFNALGALSIYRSRQHFAYFDMTWKPIKRVSMTFGYAGTFVGGENHLLNAGVVLAPLNSRQPAGTLAFNYQKPYGSIQIDLYKGLSYKMRWNYYGYNGKAPFDVPGLQSIGNQDFNGSTAEFGFRYAF
jgi:hypothetical protein